MTQNSLFYLLSMNWINSFESIDITAFLQLIRFRFLQVWGLFSGQENWFHPLQGVAFNLVY